MLKTKFLDCGAVGFACPSCGKWYKVNLSQEVPVRKPRIYEDDYFGPPGAGVECSCGAHLTILGEVDDFDVLWWNHKEMVQAAVLKIKPLAYSSEGLYYDLVRVPHGHVPANKVWLWRRFPLVVKEFRGNSYFKCPDCGSGSFYKESPIKCQVCWSRIHSMPEKTQSRLRVALTVRHVALARHDYFRRLLKNLEVLILPVLALFGKAWYVRSERSHFSDKYYRYRSLERFWGQF